MDWVIWAAAAAAGVVLAYVLLDRMTSPPRHAVLPSHYDPRNYMTDPSTVPGWCARCGTRNDPDYRYCGNCAAELPDADYDPSTERRPFGRE